MLRLIIPLLLVLLGNLAVAQVLSGKTTTKTVRLHIDGFTKSKSGAV